MERFCWKGHVEPGKLEEYVMELPVPAELVEKGLERRTLSDGQEVTTVQVKVQGGMFMPSARIFGFLYMRKN